MLSIEVERLTKSFSQFTVVDHLDFSIKRGEVFAFLGPNGAGKTTTIRMLSCLIAPTSGSAFVEGLDIAKEPLKVRAITGLLTENPSLYERLTALENMQFFAEAYGLADKADRDDKIREQLEFFGLWDRRNSRTASFSKGMKQKLAMARALVHNPPVLYLDEPTSALDPEASKEIRDLIERLSRREKHTVILCTHRLEEAERLADNVMIINKGKLVASGSPGKIRNSASGSPVVEITLAKESKRVESALKNSEGVKSLKVVGNVLRVELEERAKVQEIVRKAVLTGGAVLSVSSPKVSLEDAYLRIIKGD